MEWLAILLMGIVLGLIGGGGGILTVPILTGLFGFGVVEATGSSLFIVGVASFFGAAPAALKKEIDFARAFPLAAASVVGGFASRRFVVPAIPDLVGGVSKSTLLMSFFAMLMLVVAFRMLKEPGASASKRETGTKQLFVAVMAGLAIGLLAGTLGAGGGFLILPTLVLVLGFDMKAAVPTSLMIIALQSLAGFMGEIGNPIRWQILLAMAGVALVGMIVGGLLRNHVPSAYLRKGFAGIVIMVAAVTIVEISMNRF